MYLKSKNWEKNEFIHHKSTLICNIFEFPHYKISAKKKTVFTLVGPKNGNF